jgi:hypothetical protein
VARGRHHPAPIGCQSGVTGRALSSILPKRRKSIFNSNRPRHPLRLGVRAGGVASPASRRMGERERIAGIGPSPGPPCAAQTVHQAIDRGQQRVGGPHGSCGCTVRSAKVAEQEGAN